MKSTTLLILATIFVMAGVCVAHPDHIRGQTTVHLDQNNQQQYQQEQPSPSAFRVVEIDYVAGCEGSTNPRRKTFNCQPGDKITIRGRGFSKSGNTFFLQNAANKDMFACDHVTSSKMLPSLIQFCTIPRSFIKSTTKEVLPLDDFDGVKFNLGAQTADGRTSILRDAVTMKSSKKDEEQEENLKKLNFNDWEALKIGGLETQFEELFRRAFGTRVASSSMITNKLNVRHVKGVILHGPPGTGKTLIARTVAKILDAKNVQVVNGPEIMSKFVGESEKNLRALFGDAEADYRKNGDAAGLHVIIFDEVDAVLRPRGAGDDSAARAVYDGVTTQMLSYMDGFNTQNNLIIIGLTNRLDALDKALLRPGRFEVQIRIPLPDDAGRRQILSIHTKNIRDHGFLANDVDFAKLSRDTASFSGADLEGVVRSGVSFALQRLAKEDLPEDQFRVTYKDLQRGIREILATKGSSANTAPYFANGIIQYSGKVKHILSRIENMADTMKLSKRQRLMRFVLQGKPSTGTTALAALAARNTRFSFVTVISPESLLGLSTNEKVTRISQAFETAANVAHACIVLDKIEDILEFNVNRGSVNSHLLHELSVYLNRDPALVPHQRDSQLMIIITTSSSEALRMLSPSGAYEAREVVKTLTKREVLQVLLDYAVLTDEDEAVIVAKHIRSLGIKKLIQMIDMVRARNGIYTDLVAAEGKDLSADITFPSWSNTKDDTSAGSQPETVGDTEVSAQAGETQTDQTTTMPPEPTHVTAAAFEKVLREFGMWDDDPSSSPAADATQAHRLG